MQVIKSEITKEKFEELDALEPKEFNDVIDKTIPFHWVCGYGYYGSYLFYDKNENKYYIKHNIGDSCD